MFKSLFDTKHPYHPFYKVEIKSQAAYDVYMRYVRIKVVGMSILLLGLLWFRWMH